VLADPQALKVACLPLSEDPGTDAITLALACLADPHHPPLPTVPMPGIQAKKALRAQIHAYAKLSGGWFEGLGAAVLSVPHEVEARGFAATTLCLPWQAKPDPRSARQGLELAEDMAARCGFRRFAWFPEVATAVRALAADLAGGLPPMLAPAAVAFPDFFGGISRPANLPAHPPGGSTVAALPRGSA
jgi:hypothetical protein